MWLELLVHVQRSGVAGPFCSLVLGWLCLGARRLEAVPADWLVGRRSQPVLRGSQSGPALVSPATLGDVVGEKVLAPLFIRPFGSG